MQENGADKIILGRAHFLCQVCLVVEGVLYLSAPLYNGKAVCVLERAV